MESRNPPTRRGDRERARDWNPGRSRLCSHPSDRRTVKPHRFHREAAEEYAQAAQYYADIEPQLGERFYQEMERLIRAVCHNPARFPLFDPPARRHLSTV